MKKKQIIVFVLLTVLTVILAAVAYMNGPEPKEEKQTPTLEPAGEEEQKSDEQAPKSAYYYPMSGDYSSRVTFRWFGKLVSAGEVAPDCGQSFSGYHNADDLEVTSTEKQQPVPVYAIANGRIRQISNVNGYGGLLIMEANLEGQPVTLNYGHIDINSASVRVGDTISAGQQLALLGQGCSAQTDGERKHLHFAIHKSTEIDVRGYLPTQVALNSWINPKEFLVGQKANQPGN